jgi:hypothetical protein
MGALHGLKRYFASGVQLLRARGCDTQASRGRTARNVMGVSRRWEAALLEGRDVKNLEPAETMRSSIAFYDLDDIFRGERVKQPDER